MQVGSQIVLQAQFRNRAGVLADPTSVTCWVKKKSATTGASVTITRITTGIWEALYTIVEPGEHVWRVEATGAITVSEEKAFEVAERRVTHA